MKKEIFPRAYIVSPKQKDLIVAVDFGQGEDVSTMTITKLEENRFARIVSCERIGRAKDFNEEKIKEFLEKIECKEIEI